MKEYIGSQQAFEDEINDRYDEKERHKKEQKQMEDENEKEMYKQMEDEYWESIRQETEKLNTVDL